VSQSYLADMEQRINKEASIQSKAYIKDIENPSENMREQIFLVFKFVATPHDVLVAGLRNMQP